MLLSCRVLKNVQGVNSFEYADAAEFTEGDAPSIYVQLVDAGKAQQRYMPASGAALQVTFDHVDDARKIVRAATQPYALDPSIWRIDTLVTDKLRGTIPLRLKLTEGAVITYGSLAAAVLVYSAE